MLTSEDGDDTARPFTLVTTSPEPRPAVAAGVPESDPRISVPEVTGAILVGTPAFPSLVRHWPGGAPPNWPPPSEFCWLFCSCCRNCECGSPWGLCCPLAPGMTT